MMKEKKLIKKILNKNNILKICEAARTAMQITTAVLLIVRNLYSKQIWESIAFFYDLIQLLCALFEEKLA